MLYGMNQEPTVFSVTVKGEMEPLFERLQAMAALHGAILLGNTKNGVFSGNGVTAKYAVSGKVLTIEIHSLGYPTVMVHNHASLERAVKRFFEADEIEREMLRGSEV
jgi:hypothetical protein